jgi:hypothetical protein
MRGKKNKNKKKREEKQEEKGKKEKSARPGVLASWRSITDPFVYYSLLVSTRVSALRGVLTHV